MRAHVAAAIYLLRATQGALSRVPSFARSLALRIRGGWERAACRTAAKKELDELCEAVTAALGDAQQAQADSAAPGPNAALRTELLRSFDALANAVAAVPAVVAPVQRALAGWAGAIGSAVAFSLPLPQPAKQHKPLPPLPTQQPQAQASPVPGGGAAVAAAIEAAAAAEVTSAMTPGKAASPDAGALMSPAWWARPDPKAEVAPEAEAEAEVEAAEEPSAAEEEAPASPQPPLPAAAGGCCVIS